MNHAVIPLDLAALVAEARAARHRRLVVLEGDRVASWAQLHAAIASTDLDQPYVAHDPGGAPIPAGWEAIPAARFASLLGRSPAVAAVDLHVETDLAAVCIAAGAVRGGGLVVLLTPPFAAWPDAPDRLRRRLAPPPFEDREVGRRLVARLIESLRGAAGVRRYRIGAGGEVTAVVPSPLAPVVPLPARPLPVPDAPGFDEAIYRSARTADQLHAVRALEALAGPGPVVVVLTADRGRGKSSALGLAARGLVAGGASVGITGPGPEAVAEVLARAGGSAADAAIAYLEPAAVPAAAPDALLVDEAAQLSVPVLDALLEAAPRIAFATTVHGYEGTGQGFAIRFMEHLRRRDADLREVSLEEPIRWAPGDPVEAWAHRTFALDAAPSDLSDGPPAPGAVEIRGCDPGELAGDEGLLRALFGLLIHAHYRTTPLDLARLLDGPNVRTWVARHDGRVLGALLLAREGGLSAARCGEIAAGRTRVRGNMLPETLICHLGEQDAGTLPAWRVLRIAVHPAVRGRGLARRLLDAAAADPAAGPAAYLGAGFAATPDLIRFWTRCGFVPARMAVRRSEVSGEFSAVVLRALDDRGRALVERLGDAFLRRFPHVLADALRDLDPAVALAMLRSAGASRPIPRPDLTPADWRVAHACAHGPLIYDAVVQPLWEIVRHAAADPARAADLRDEDWALLVRKVLQHRPWEAIVGEVAPRDLRPAIHVEMRRLRSALRPLLPEEPSDE